MKTFEYETWDVFTATRFAGNQLAVVMDASGLTSEQMQTITREFNYAETTFVLPPEDSAHTARVRIFTKGYEMPFAGHPTVGTAIAIAKVRGLDGALSLELNAGLFPVDVRFDGDEAFAEFANPNRPCEMGVAPAASLIEAALSLPAGIVDRDAHRPRRFGAGVDYVYVRAPLAAVRAARYDSAAWSALQMENTVGLLLYAERGDAPDAAYHVRMFAPDADVVEDAATGSAAAAFPGQIAASQKLENGTHRWMIEQGVEMGRPSQISASLDVEAGAVTAVRIGGEAVQVCRGVLTL